MPGEKKSYMSVKSQGFLGSEIRILKREQIMDNWNYSIVDAIIFKRNVSDHSDLNDVFPLMKKTNLLKKFTSLKWMRERKTSSDGWRLLLYLTFAFIFQTRKNLVLFIFIYLAKRQGKVKDFDKRYLWQPFFAKRLFLLHLFSLF